MISDCLSHKLAWLYEILLQEWPLVVPGGVVCFLAARYIIYIVKCREVKSKAAGRKKRSDDNIVELRKCLQQEHIDCSITELPFEELQSSLRCGQLNTVDVLQAYQSKAIEVNDAVNAITDVIPDAKTRSVLLDRVEPSERGPLHGIPISLKESVGLKGKDCTVGFSVLIDNPLPDDAILLKVLKAKGAIPFIRTNIPQGMKSFATDNPIYGLTVNPLNHQRSSGGSSGGEGAIVGGGGSILGVGSDIGGSIRIPSCYCGIAGLKPSWDRLSTAGVFGYGTNTGGQKLIPSSYGPMSKEVGSLVHFMRAVLGPEMFSMDPNIPPIPFRDEIFHDKKPLRIGYYVYDGCTQCVPAVVRGVHLAKEALEGLGHTVVKFDPPDVSFAINEINFPVFFGDELEGYRELVEYDDTCDVMYNSVTICQYPYFVRWLMAKWTEVTQNDPQNTALLKRPPIRKVSDWFKKGRILKEYQDHFFKQWNAKALDIVICPCMPSVAFKNGLDRKMLVCITYTALFNLLNYPAGTLPVTTVTQDDVIKARDPTNYNPKTDVEKLIQKDFESAEGMPVGVQVAGLPYREEMVLRIMSELEHCLKGTMT